MRGEYHAAPPTTPTQSELPPRARRILLQAFLHVFPCGTTSACAENTLFPAAGQVKSRNYLRVRGEYAAAVADPVLCSGTTSACAENTSHQFTGGSIRGNYLRVRGEYHLEVWMDQLGKELPPRARRIRRTSLLGVASVGTTSACAENTSRLSVLSSFSRNYLRVRGEYDSSLDIFAFPLELPPRARRIPATTGPGVGHTGTTSACAENTAFSDSPSP